MDLNTVWFVLFGVLIIGYAILDGFDFGVGILSLFAKDDTEKRLHFNAIGPVWDGNEVWLLTGGGALFAAFPNVYATVFSGFYLALMLLLVAFIARAVSFEFRSKVASPAWRAAWDWAFGIGSFLPALLLGVALGNIMRGVPLAADTEFAGTFLGLLNPFALVMGLLSVAMMTTHGALWLAGKTDGALQERATKAACWGWTAWIALFALATAGAWIVAPWLVKAGLGRPPVWLGLLLVAAGFAGQTVFVKGKAWTRAFVSSSLTIAGQLLVVGFSLYPRLVPALGNLDASLTIYNASSTPRTLGVMLVIALVGVPIVLAYTVFIYRVFKGKVVLGDESY